MRRKDFHEIDRFAATATIAHRSTHAQVNVVLAREEFVVVFLFVCVDNCLLGFA